MGLRMAASATATATERELGRVQAEIGKLVQALKDGVPASIVKDPLIALEAQQTELRARQLNRLRCCIRTWRTSGAGTRQSAGWRFLVMRPIK
jgi:hypothetical protein